MLKKCLVTLLVISAAIVGVRAQRGGRGGRGDAEGAAPAAKPYVPTSAASLARDPNAFIGENVTLTAAVSQILSHSAFVVEQRLPAGARGSAKAPAGAMKDVLVLAPILNAPVD